MELSEKFGDVYYYKTLQALTPFVGNAMARMMTKYGYTDLFILAEADPYNIRELPHVGEATFRGIEECLASRGLAFDYSKYRSSPTFDPPTDPSAPSSPQA